MNREMVVVWINSKGEMVFGFPTQDGIVFEKLQSSLEMNIRKMRRFKNVHVIHSNVSPYIWCVCMCLLTAWYIGSSYLNDCNT